VCQPECETNLVGHVGNGQSTLDAGQPQAFDEGAVSGRRIELGLDELFSLDLSGNK
jgi:hypothetical protein